MAVQGQALSEKEVYKIVWLLSKTDMAIPEIAARMCCSRSAVASVNRRWQVRNYDGMRSTWKIVEHENISSNAEAGELSAQTGSGW